MRFGALGWFGCCWFSLIVLGLLFDYLYSVCSVRQVYCGVVVTCHLVWLVGVVVSLGLLVCCCLWC